jgi:hypothetical protein
MERSGIGLTHGAAAPFRGLRRPFKVFSLKLLDKTDQDHERTNQR